MKWFRENWEPLTLGVVVLAAIGLFAAYWSDTNRLSALGSLFGFIVAALLFLITVRYVRTNQNTLRLMQEQWDAQNEVEIKFGLKVVDSEPLVWIINYGRANVVIHKIRVETPNGGRVMVFKNIIVRAGNRKTVSLPHRKLGKLDPPAQNIQVTLFCHSTTQKFEQTKVFTLLLTEWSKVQDARKGLHGLWPVGCPKCEKAAGIFMVTDRLKSFDQAMQRQKELESEVAASCPKHSSKWLLTIEHVTKAKTADIEA